MRSMNTATKAFLALVSLVGAFYVSISYRYGDPGWQLQFHARAAAQDDAPPADDYDLKSLAILNRAVIHIKENYVDPTRLDERRMIGAAMEEVQRAVAELLVEVERDSEGVPTQLTVRVDQAEATFDLREVGNPWQMSFKFKDIFRFIQENLRHHTKLRDIEYAAINGMLSTLDPHSVLLRPEDYREMKLSTRGKFGGLGIVISIRDGHLTIINPIDDTPASRAGLKAGDHIVQIGYDSTVNMALSDAVNLLRGEPDTSVDIWVQREGWKEPRKFTLKRDDIKVKSVASRSLGKGVGLVRVRNFQNTTFDELQGALRDLRRKGALRGVVLDLRGNPGGLLDQAIKVADLFIESGPLVTTVGFGDRMREPKMATRGGTEPDYPLVVLTDNSSASASEIVAGALKNHHRALLIGQQTFGKGSVQVIYDNKDDSALKLTIAQYLTPGDISIQSVGIVPDVNTYAAVIDDEGTDLFRSEALRSGEKDLPAHLEHASAEASKAQKPKFALKYLQDEALTKKIRENPNDLIVDFEIELARDVVLATRKGHVEGILEDALPLLEARAAEQNEAIAKALADRGVDWTPVATVTGTPTAEVTVATDHPGDRVLAGETLKTTVTVRNTGNAPFVQLRALSKSENDHFEGHEFLFGNIPPGEARSWTVLMKVPKSALTRRDPVKLEFAAARGAVPPAAALKVGVEQLPRPRFALSYRLDDAQLGNGDGVLQPGETAELVVEARNVGAGDAQNLLGILRNDDADESRGIFIQRGRVKGEALAVGERRSLRFKFKVKEQIDSTAVPVDVAVTDSEIRETTSERVDLRVVTDAEPLEATRVRLSPKAGTAKVALRSLYAPSAPIIATAKDAVADARLGHWYRVPTRVGGERAWAWVDARTVEVASDADGRGATDVDAIDPSGPPVIALSERSPPPETHDDALTLSGEVLGERLVQDLLIYVNNRKVFFKANREGLATRDPFRFSARVPLDEGVNRITVIARQDDEAQSRHTLIVHREK